MIKILKDASVGDVIKGIGDQPEVRVNKWGSVKVKVHLQGKDRFFSRNEIAKKFYDLGDAKHKEWLKNAFKEIEDQAQQKLGNKHSFKRFSHGVRSFFGKMGFNFRKEMSESKSPVDMGFQPKSETDREVFLSGTSSVELFQLAAQTVVNDEDWDAIDQYLEKKKKANQLGSDDVKYVLAIATDKPSPKKGKYCNLLGDLLQKESDKIMMYEQALNEKNKYSLKALYKLEDLLMPFHSRDTLSASDLMQLQESEIDQLDKNEHYVAARTLLSSLSGLQEDEIKERHLKAQSFLLKAAQKGHVDAAYLCFLNADLKEEKRKDFLQIACEGKNKVAEIISRDSSLQEWILNGYPLESV